MQRSSIAKSLAAAMIVGMTAVAISGAASAETWRFASKMPAESPEGKVFQYFADEVAKRTDGALKIKVFPSEQLGKSKAILEQLQRGTVHIYAEGPAWLSKWAKGMAWAYPRFVFKDRAAWVRFMNSDLVTGWRKQAEEASGVRVLGDITGVVRGPYRVVVSNKPLASLEDFKGLKMRQADNRSGVMVWRALGVEVRTLPWTDTYQAIKTGIVESVTSPAALVESMRFYEVAPYVIRLDAFYQAIAFMMNGKAYDSLPKDQQQALVDAHAAASAYSHEIMGKSVKESFARMEKEGAKFSSIDPAPFVEATRALMEQWEAEGELPKGFIAAADKANAGK